MQDINALLKFSGSYFINIENFHKQLIAGDSQ